MDKKEVLKTSEKELLRRVRISPEEANKVVDEIGYNNYLKLLQKEKESK